MLSAAFTPTKSNRTSLIQVNCGRHWMIPYIGLPEHTDSLALVNQFVNISQTNVIAVDFGSPQGHLLRTQSIPLQQTSDTCCCNIIISQLTVT